MLRMVVRFADIPCPDALEMFNYESGFAGHHITTVCGLTQRNDESNDDTAIYTDCDGIVVTFRSFPGERTGRGFFVTFYVVDPKERRSC